MQTRYGLISKPQRMSVFSDDNTLRVTTVNGGRSELKCAHSHSMIRTVLMIQDELKQVGDASSLILRNQQVTFRSQSKTQASYAIFQTPLYNLH